MVAHPFARPAPATLLSGLATAAAILLSVVMPYFPLLRWRAWHLAAIVGVVWLGLLYVFFWHFAGPAFLGHLALAAGVSGLALMPRELRRWENEVAARLMVQPDTRRATDSR